MRVIIRNNRRRFLLPLMPVCVLCVGVASAATAQNANNQGEPMVNVTDYDVVDLAVKDAELAQVLQMLSLQSRKNIIAGKNVAGTVTANLYDVTFAEALDAILTVNGYVWREEGNFIYVYTAEEWKEMEELKKQTVSHVFELDHLSAETALEMITPFLSERGRAAAQGAVQKGFQPNPGDGGADEYSFAVKVVVNDFEENIQKITEILEELDQRPDQVLVEATILQTQLDETNAFGIDFSIVSSMDFTDILSPLNPVGALIDGEDGFQPADNKARAGQVTAGNTGGPATLKIGYISDDVSVFLRVLDEVAHSMVLARPKIMVLNRQRAEVLVGARVGYLSTTATETTTTQTVEFLDTGVQLVLRPFISKDGTIRMELKPSVSEANLRTVTDANGAVLTIPDELTNEITTNVRVRDGQTLVLGGLFRESTQVTRRQVPFLGDIPIIGIAFQGQDDNVQRQEIIFLITPTITHDETMWADGEEMMALTDLVRLGARQGLLGWSQVRMTSSHNQAAVDAAAAGKNGLAIFHINNSLRLNPNQAEMRRLKQELSGKVAEGYDHSLLERVLHEQLELSPQSKANPRPAVHSAKNPTAGIDPFNNVSWSSHEHPNARSRTSEPIRVVEGWGQFNANRAAQSRPVGPAATGGAQVDSFFQQPSGSGGQGARQQVGETWWFLPFSWQATPRSDKGVVGVPTSNFE